MTYKFSAVVEQDEDGCYAYCPELPGCQTQGVSVEDALANLEEAATLYLETLSPDEIRTMTTRTILTTSLEVAAGA